MNKILSLTLLLLALGVAQGESNSLVSVFTDKDGRMHYDWKMTLQDAGSGAISISNSPFPDGEFVWYRKINTTDFSVISTSNFSYPGSENARIYRGNIIDFVDEIDQDGKKTIKVTQFNFEQNIILPSFSINGSFVKSHVESNYVYVFSTEPQTLTLVRFTVGETKLGETIMIPVQIPYEDIQMAKFSNHKLLLTLSPSSKTNSDPILQEIIVDLENGVSQINPIPVFSRTLSCKAYVNNKFYGSICVYPYRNYYITKNASQSSQNVMNMLPMNYPYRKSVSAVYPAGDYILTIHKDPENRGYYQLLDLETMQSISLVGFGKYDYFLPVEFYQIENGDVYLMAISQGLDFSNNDYYINNIQLKIINPKASTEEDATSEDDKLIQYFLA